jgi:hypothetical protein
MTVKRLALFLGSALVVVLLAGCAMIETAPTVERITEENAQALILKVFEASQRKDVGPILSSLTDDFTLTIHDPANPRPVVVARKDYGGVLLRGWILDGQANADQGAEILEMHVTVASDGRSAEVVRRLRSWGTRKDAGVRWEHTSELRNQLRIEGGRLKMARAELFPQPSERLSSQEVPGGGDEGL